MSNVAALGGPASGVGSSRRRAALTAFKATVSAGLLGLLIWKAGIASLPEVLRHVSAVWLLGALAVGFVGTVVQATQWRAILATVGLRRSTLRCLRVVYIGNTFNAVLPSSIGGDVVRAVAIADSASQRMHGASTVVLQRICNFPGMVLVLTLGLLLTLGDAAAVRVRPVAAVAVVAVTAIVAVCMSPLLGYIARRNALARSRVGRMASTILQALDTFRGRRRALAAAWLRGTLFWVIVVLNQWMFMHAVGIDASLPLAAVIVTTVNALTMLPVSINGFGLREGSFALLLSVGGLASAAQGAAAGLLVSGQSLLWALVGLICWWTPGRDRPTAPASALEVA